MTRISHKKNDEGVLTGVQLLRAGEDTHCVFCACQWRSLRRCPALSRMLAAVLVATLGATSGVRTILSWRAHGTPYTHPLHASVIRDRGTRPQQAQKVAAEHGLAGGTLVAKAPQCLVEAGQGADALHIDGHCGTVEV